jgi:hypothetical protein
MIMRRYLLVLDKDLLAVDSEFGLEPINYFLVQQEREPCDVVVLSLVDTGLAGMPAVHLLLAARAGTFPMPPRPDHDVSAAAEHRMNLAVRHLKAIGCRADGIISDADDLVKAVRFETRSHDYANVVLATGRRRGFRLARALRLDAVHRLRWRLGQRLVVFPIGRDAPHPTLAL